MRLGKKKSVVDKISSYTIYELHIQVNACTYKPTQFFLKIQRTDNLITSKIV